MQSYISINKAIIFIITSLLFVPTIAGINIISDPMSSHYFSYTATNQKSIDATSYTNTNNSPFPSQRDNIIFFENFDDTPWEPDPDGDIYMVPAGWNIEGIRTEIIYGGNAPSYYPTFWSAFDDKEPFPKSHPYCAALWWNKAKDEWLISPEINTSEYVGLQLIFSSIYLRPSVPYMDPDSHNYIKVSSDNGQSWTTLGDLNQDEEFDYPDLVGDFNWHKHPVTIDLSDYDQSNSLTIAFHAHITMSGIWIIDNVQLVGNLTDDVPPVTTCYLDGTINNDAFVSNVTVHFEAFDEPAGVAYTMYKLDGGEYQLYESPFIVSTNGEHTVAYYSVDHAGNVEEEQVCSFSINFIKISLTGGFGLSTTVRNIGKVETLDFTGTINIHGFVFGEKEKTVTVNLAPGEETTVSQRIFGFGKINITVIAALAEKQATGFIVSFFVYGV